MTVATLRPNLTPDAGGWAAVGAATIHAATSDDSDSSYVEGAPPDTDLVLDFTTLAIPASAQIRSITPKVRVSRPGGASLTASVTYRISSSAGDSPADSTPVLGAGSPPQTFTGTARFYDPAGNAWTQAAIDAIRMKVALGAAPQQGYWAISSSGGVYAFDLPYFGNALGLMGTATAVEILPAADYQGYIIASSDGGVFAFGSAQFHGSQPGIVLAGAAGTPGADGYWLVSSSGAVYAFGDAAYNGNATVTVGKVAVEIFGTPTGAGYWIVDSGGAVFALGDATFHGNDLGITATSAAYGTIGGTNGYWLLGSNGEVYPHGSVADHGDAVGLLGSGNTAVQIIATPTSLGYWIISSDGGVFALGDAGFHGSLPGTAMTGGAYGEAL